MSFPVDKRRLERAIQVVRERTALESFEANDGGQQKVVKSTAHELIIAGGNSSGKTYLGTILCAWHVVAEEDKNGRLTGKTIHPYLDLRIPTAGKEGWISCYSRDTQRDVLRPIVDRVLEPYMLHSHTVYDDGDVYKTLYFKGVDRPSWINFKWQTQGIRAYAGPKKSFVFLDEPHMQSIYKEARARLFRSGGYMWTCLTPVVDEDSPVRSQDVIWMRDEIVEPYQRNPDKFPIREVIYMDVTENYRYLDGDFIDEVLAMMSEKERMIRKSGLFIIFSGMNAFDQDMLLELLNYLEDHEDESTPEYGNIVWDMFEDEEWRAEFVPNSLVTDFPDKPQNQWVIKVWERAVPEKGLQIAPEYLISVDVAEGVPGGDYTNAYVFRTDTMRIVAGLHGHITEEQLAKQLWLLGHYYNSGYPDYEPAQIAIEVRNYGASTQRYLMWGNSDLGIPQYPAHRFYWRPSPADLTVGREYAHSPGWDTNSRTRKFVITGMRQAVSLAYRAIKEGRKCPIPDIGCLREAREFILNVRSGRYEGHPDDRLFSLGIGHVVYGGEAFAFPTKKPPQEKPQIDTETRFFATQNAAGDVKIGFNIEGAIAKALEQPGELNF